MTEAQKRVLEWIGIAVLVGATAFMVTLVVQIMTDTHLVGADSEDPQLSFAWRQASTVIGMGAALNIAFAAMLAIVTMSVSLVAKAYERTVEVAVIVTICVVGAAAGFLLLGELDASPDGAVNSIRYQGGFADDPASGLNRIRAFVYGMIGWFGVYASTVLGLKVADGTGALDKLISQLRGA